ncbi:hypothetical protein SO694_00025395 [Aureococcus anophagefferens]|uniref:Uncharacterized protein n=1 Tax=Aureococcus anophagefferens TaxID=44056 RepID=A0ABR1FVB6_AURAN
MDPHAAELNLVDEADASRGARRRFDRDRALTGRCRPRWRTPRADGEARRVSRTAAFVATARRARAAPVAKCLVTRKTLTAGAVALMETRAPFAALGDAAMAFPVDVDVVLHRARSTRSGRVRRSRATRAFVKTLGNGAALRVAVYGPEHSEREAFAASWLARSSAAAPAAATADARLRQRSPVVRGAALGRARRLAADRGRARQQAEALPRPAVFEPLPKLLKRAPADEGPRRPALGVSLSEVSNRQLSDVGAGGWRSRWAARVAANSRAIFRATRSLRESIDHGGDAVRVHKRVSIAGLAVVDVDAADNAVPVLRAALPVSLSLAARVAVGGGAPAGGGLAPAPSRLARQVAAAALERFAACGADAGAWAALLADAKAGRGDISAEDAARFEGLGLL